MKKSLIDDDYLLLHLTEYFTVRDFISLTKIGKRFRETMITDALDKRILDDVGATFTANTICKEFMFLSKETINNWHRLKFKGKFELGFSYNNLFIDSQMSVQINTPLLKFNCSEHSVFGNDVPNEKDFPIQFADTSSASIKLHYVIDEDKLVSIDEISCEYRCDMQSHLNKMRIIRKCASTAIISLVSYFVLYTPYCSKNYVAVGYILCFYGGLIAWCISHDFTSDNEIRIKKI
jgi:hypothetical protein